MASCPGRPDSSPSPKLTIISPANATSDGGSSASEHHADADGGQQGEPERRDKDPCRGRGLGSPQPSPSVRTLDTVIVGRRPARAGVGLARTRDRRRVVVRVSLALLEVSSVRTHYLPCMALERFASVPLRLPLRRQVLASGARGRDHGPCSQGRIVEWRSRLFAVKPGSSSSLRTRCLRSAATNRAIPATLYSGTSSSTMAVRSPSRLPASGGVQVPGQRGHGSDGHLLLGDQRR